MKIKIYDIFELTPLWKPATLFPFLQLATLLVTSTKNIESMDARPGSTVVTATVVSYEEQEADELKKNVEDLVKLFEKGQVKLVRIVCSKEK